MEGLGGLGESVGEGLVPVHVRTAGADLLRALFTQGCGHGRVDQLGEYGGWAMWVSAAPWMIAAASAWVAASAPAIG